MVFGEAEVVVMWNRENMPEQSKIVFKLAISVEEMRRAVH